MKFVVTVAFVVAVCRNVAFAKIRGGSSAFPGQAFPDQQRFEDLLTSFSHDDLLTAYHELQGSIIRNASDGSAAAAAGNDDQNDTGDSIEAQAVLAKRLLHRLKALPMVERGMSTEEFEEYNEKMYQLDLSMARVPDEAGNDSEEHMQHRLQSKQLAKEVRDTRRKYMVARKEHGGMTEAEKVAYGRVGGRGCGSRVVSFAR